MKTDGELLSRYLDARDAGAFEEVSGRHAGMVYGVCRRILGVHADAEDAAQAVFVALVKSAAKLRGSRDIAGWLYRTAVLTSRYHARSRAHRRRREEEAAAMKEEPAAPAVSWEEVRPQLDSALMSVPERYRRAVLLRHMEGRSRAEAAEILGVNENTAGTWIHRGLELLRSRLKRKGVGVSAVALAELLVANQPAAPTALLGAISTIGAAGAAGLAGAVPSTVHAIAEGAAQVALWFKVKIVAAAVAAAAIAAGTGVVVHRAMTPPLATAEGKSVKLARPFSGKYPGGGAAGLTDGRTAREANHRDPCWHGLEGPDLEAVIDMGAATRIRTLSARFMQDVSQGIFMPPTVEYAVSGDGKDFRDVAVVKNTVAVEDRARQARWFTASVDVRARYVRVRARTLGKIPDWIWSRGRPTWLFVDEVLVNQEP
jgi:RNA polymerase sigma factor (sigma-70 family)